MVALFGFGFLLVWVTVDRESGVGMGLKSFAMKIAFGVTLVSCGWTQGLSTRIEELRATSFPEISAAVQVFTEAPDVRLSTDDFRVYENEKPVKDFRVEVDPRPVYLALVLDESGSMREAMPDLKKAAFDFLAQMDDRVHLGLYSFATEVHRRSSFRRDLRLAQSQIQNLASGGATRLYDALILALEDLGSYPSGVRRVVVVFTDGRDERSKQGPPLSKATAKEVAKRAKRQGVPLYFLGLGREISRKLLTKMAAVTGGESVFSLESQELRRAFARMGRSLRTSYRLQYTTRNPKSDGTIRKVAIRSRFKGKVDQGTGRYRAPKILDKTASNLYFQNRGCMAYRKVRSALAGLKSYELVAEGESSEGLKTNVRVVRKEALGEEIELKLASDQGLASTRILETPTRRVASLGTEEGSLTTALTPKLHGGLGNPVSQVFRWLGASEDSLASQESAGCEGYALERPGFLRVAHGGLLQYSTQTFLPVRFVTLDETTGAGSVVAFRRWNLSAVGELWDPPAVALSEETQKFVAQTSAQALQVAGLSLGMGLRAGLEGARLGVEGAQAGMKGAKIGLEAARLGLVGADLGIQGAQVGLQAAKQTAEFVDDIAIPYSLHAADASLRTAGGLIKLLSGPEFQAATRAPSKASPYFAKVTADSLAYQTALAQASLDYAEDVLKWSETLTKDLLQSMQELGIQVTDQTLSGFEAGKRGIEIGKQATAQAQKIEAEAERLTQSSEEMGKSLETMGENLEAVGEGLQEMGESLKGLEALKGLKSLEGLGNW